MARPGSLLLLHSCLLVAAQATGANETTTTTLPPICQPLL